MYHTHFALREEPFGVSPDRRFFYQTEQHREALATLYYAVRQRRGFALIVGRPGLGKTSVLVQLLEMLRGEAETAYLPHPYFDRNTVLESILVSLGLEPTNSPAQNHRLFYQYLLRTHNTGKTCVVVFDEAQNLNRETLEAIRMLSNFETATDKLVQIVLSGQPGLADMLVRPEMEQMRQRLNVIARLKPMSFDQTREYIRYRNRIAGASSDLFEPDAIEMVVEASRGIPRNVNTICFNSITLAFGLDLNRVGAAQVTEVLRDLDLGNLDSGNFDLALDSSSSESFSDIDFPKCQDMPPSAGTRREHRVSGGWRKILLGFLTNL
jgi:type II secretory pathway predicted ATPase ExeA